MPKVAVISDIHANLEALSAVMDDARALGVEDILCLGDVVGYGPDPIACVDIIRESCRLVICGNHDEALISAPWGFNQMARDAIEWTRRVMRPRFYRWGARRRWSFLSDLPLTSRWGDFLLVHGSPRNPTSEYVLPYHVAWPPPGMFEEIFAAFTSVCFVGHTHVAGVFYETPRFIPQREIEGPVSFGQEKLLINVGSVGQPRDHDCRACYLVFDEREFEFRRVAYPLERTQEKIRSIPYLDDRLAERLAEGE